MSRQRSTQQWRVLAMHSGLPRARGLLGPLYLVQGSWRFCRQNRLNEVPLWAQVQLGGWGGEHDLLESVNFIQTKTARTADPRAPWCPPRQPPPMQLFGALCSLVLRGSVTLCLCSPWAWGT